MERADKPPARIVRTAVLAAAAYLVIVAVAMVVVGSGLEALQAGQRDSFISFHSRLGVGLVVATAVGLFLLVLRLGVVLWRTARSEAVGELARAHQAALFDHGPDAALIFEEVRVVAVNRAAADLFGGESDALVGRNAWELSPAAQPDGARSRHVACERIFAAREGDVTRFPWRHRRLDGHEFDAEVSLTVLPGSPRRVLAWVRDVTQARDAQARLAAANEQLRLLVEGTPHFFFYVHDLDGDITYISPTVETITGRRVDEWLGQRHWFTTANTVNDEARQATQRHLAGQLDSEPILVEVEHADGHPVLLEIYEYGRFQDGRLVGLQGLAQDITQRQQAEDALRDSEERYRTLAEISRDLIFIIDSSLAVEYVSSAAAAALGKPAEEVVGRPLRELFPESTGERMAGGLNRVLASGAPSNTEEVFAIGGGEVWLDTWLVPIREESGRVKAVLGVSRDVTQRKRTELIQAAIYKISQAATTAASLEELFPAIHAIVGELMPAKNLYIALWAADQDVVSFPYFVDECDPPPTAKKAGKGLTEYVLRTGEPLLASPDVFEKLVASGAVEDIGAPSVDWLGVPLRSRTAVIGVLVVQSYTEGVRYGEEEKAVLSFVSTQVAVAIERKRAERELLESEERYRRLVELSPDGIAVHSEGKVVFVNSRGARLLGYSSPAQVVGKPMLDFVHPDYREAVVRRAMAAEQHGMSQPFLEEKFLRADGTTVDVEVASTPFTFEGKSAVQVVVRDISERRRVEEHLRQAQKMEAIGLLAGGVAHDFNNLLQALLSTTEVLRSGVADPDRLAVRVAELEAHIRRGASLTRQLLLFSRREVTRAEAVDLNEVLRGAADLLRRLVPENISMELELVPSPLPVKADQGQLEQVLVNLVVNGSDAMPGGGLLKVASGMAGEEWVFFEVQDSGCGMKGLVRERIFEPFFTTKDVGKGSGLGLAVVHGIIARHGGRVDVLTSEGKGSMFRVVLPRCEEEPRAVEQKASHVTVAAGPRRRVLLVEDEPAARQGLEELLDLLGYSVVSAASGEEALLVPRQPRVDVVLTDLMLPGISGLTLSQQVQARWAGSKVVIMSGYAADGAVREAVVAGAVRYLQKPFDMEALASELRAVDADLEGSDGEPGRG